MGKVVTYANNKFQCFCQLKLEDGARILISIASAPTPSIKVMKLGMFGLFPTQTIWKYNAAMAGGSDAYVRKMINMFQDSLEARHPLDIIRDRLLGCQSISEVRKTLLTAEQAVR